MASLTGDEILDTRLHRFDGRLGFLETASVKGLGVALGRVAERGFRVARTPRIGDLARYRRCVDGHAAVI